MKRIQKGFTLIELIIVLAIFGIILALVMSFVDPVAKIMTKASVRERTAAYVDNIGEYVDKSLRYAEFMRVYNGAYVKDGDPTSTFPSEDKAVEEIVKSCLNGAVDDAGNFIKGKVRILKFINNATGSYEPGHIYESIYSFTTGDYVEKTDDAGNVIGTLVDIDPIVISSKLDQEVVNPEHFEEYSYYYNTGFFTLDNLDDPSKYVSAADPTKSFAPTRKAYYSALYPIMYDGDNNGVLDDPLTMNTLSNENLCINVVAYKNDEADNIEFVNHEKSDGTTEVVPIFKSPSHLTATSMSLVNVIATHDLYTAVYIRRKLDATGDQEVKDSKKQFENVMTVGNPYAIYTADDSINDGNIYIIFITPDEINDTNLNYD